MSQYSSNNSVLTTRVARNPSLLDLRLEVFEEVAVVVGQQTEI
jgi:hypothetical protein